MGIELTVVDESGELERYISELDEEVLIKLVEAAEELDLSCLKFISFDGDTIFNEIQAAEICQEVEALMGSSRVERYVLTLIKEAADQVSNGMDSYIKFTPNL